MSKGFKQFLWKMGLFTLVFLAIQLITVKLSSNTKLPSSLTPFYLVDLAKVGFFILILFFVYCKERLSKLKESNLELKDFVLFGVLELISLIFYFKYKLFVLENLGLVESNLILFQFLTYLILSVAFVFLELSIFGYSFTRYFIKKFKKDLIIFLGLFIVLYFLSSFIQNLWPYFSFIVATSVVWLLVSANLMFQGDLPIIQFKDFIVGVDSPCSGIESLFLFSILYFFIISFDWSLLNKKKLFLVFIPGLISVFLLNIIRIYLLVLLGAVYPDFALGIFHTNASWILFLVYFGIFWRVFYKWMRV